MAKADGPRPAAPTVATGHPAAVTGPTGTAAAPRAAHAAAAQVPTVIDAGQGHASLTRVVGSPWTGGVIAGGVLVALAGIVIGARRRA